MSNKEFEIRKYNVSPTYLAEVREIFYHPAYYEPKTYTNNSRYSNLRRLFDKERGKYFHENWIKKTLSVSNEDEYFTVTKSEEDRLDLIANYFYSTPRYWWVIALANDIIDPFDIPVGTQLRIPPILTIFKEGGVIGG